MTVIASNPRTLSAPPARALATRLVIAWPCSRRTTNARDHRMLERVAFVLSAEPFDLHHATIEAWIESSDGSRALSLASQKCRCAASERLGMLHIDVHDERGERLLALSLFDRSAATSALLYAQTPLIARAGFKAGALDVPTLR